MSISSKYEYKQYTIFGKKVKFIFKSLSGFQAGVEIPEDLKIPEIDHYCVIFQYDGRI